MSLWLRLLLVLSLVGCAAPRMEGVPKCAPWFIINEYGDIDIEKSKCVCTKKWVCNDDKIGNLTDEVEAKPIMYCNKGHLFPKESWKSITHHWLDVWKWSKSKFKKTPDTDIEVGD